MQPSVRFFLRNKNASAAVDYGIFLTVQFLVPRMVCSELKQCAMHLHVPQTKWVLRLTTIQMTSYASEFYPQRQYRYVGSWKVQVGAKCGWKTLLSTVLSMQMSEGICTLLQAKLFSHVFNLLVMICTVTKFYFSDVCSAKISILSTSTFV